jgi:lipopolysaccharide biosynthesis glycosyltransferase
MKITPIYPEKNAIVLFCDKNYYDYAKVTIYSLVDCISPDKTYDIVLISDSEELDINLDLPKNVSLRVFPMEPPSGVTFYESVHLTKVAYYRLFIPKIFKEYSRVLYLDGDLVILQNIDEIFRTEFQENEVIGCIKEFHFWELIKKKPEGMPKQFKKIHEYYKEILGLTNSDPYINSGVLLFDIQKCLDFGFVEKSLELIEKNPFPDKYFHCHDQDVINCICKGRMHFFSNRYNFLSVFVSQYSIDIKYYRKKIDPKEVQALIEDSKKVKILHFASYVKPWKKPYVDYKLSVLWWKVAMNHGLFEHFAEKLSKNVRQKILDRLNPKDLGDWE